MGLSVALSKIALRAIPLHNRYFMETPEQPDQSESDASPRVVAVVVSPNSVDLTSVFTSIDAQVYEPAAIFVVSKDRPKANVAAPAAQWAPSVPEVISALPAAVDYVWILDPQAYARPDALGALVETAARVDASVVGSKLLNRDRDQELVSVGGSTDVFGFPLYGY